MKITIPVAMGCLVVAILIAGWWLWGSNVKLVTGGTFYATQKSEIVGNAVSIAVGDILIFKAANSEMGAICFEQMTSDWGADYTTWYLPKGGDIRTLFSAAPYKGHVFERYWRRRTKADSYHLDDIGGEYEIKWGPFTFEWSASTWVYLPKGFSVLVTSNKTINQIDGQDKLIEWRTIPNEVH
jgi:hypothetical protein